MSKYITFGIDQAFGKTAIVANFENSKKLLYKVIETTPFEQHFDKVIRAVEIADGILDFILPICHENMMTHDAYICIEGLSHGSAGKMASANRDLAGLQFIIISTLMTKFEAHEIALCAPKQLKKHATDNGNATKNMMVDAVANKSKDLYDALVKMPQSHGRFDVADAFWLSDFSHAMLKKRDSEG